MEASNAGIALIAQFEGCRLKAYKAVSTEKYYTIGFGHYGADVKQGQQITYNEALNLLKTDVKKYEAKVNKYQKKYAFNQNEYDALVSFAYNVGSIDGLTASGRRSRETIAAKMLLYNKSGGHVLQGLVNRRVAERKLFLTPVMSDKLITETAWEVIAGRWGNGADRVTKLEAAGYDYEAVQNKVNELLRG